MFFFKRFLVPTTMKNISDWGVVSGFGENQLMIHLGEFREGWLMFSYLMSRQEA